MYIKKNVIIYLILIIFQFIYCVSLTTFFNKVGLEFCIADYLIDIFSSLYSGIVLSSLITYFLFNEFKNDFLPNIILSFGSKRKLVIRQLVKSIIISLSFTIAIIASTILISSFMTNSFINWDKPISYFANNAGFIIKDIHFINVGLSAFIVMFAKNLIICLLVIYCYWGAISKWICFIIIIALSCIETVFSGLKLFNNVLNIGYEFWETSLPSIYMIGYFLVINVFLLIMIGYETKKREFINEKS